MLIILILERINNQKEIVVEVSLKTLLKTSQQVN
jgi:hypothetical protein